MLSPRLKFALCILFIDPAPAAMPAANFSRQQPHRELPDDGSGSMGHHDAAYQRRGAKQLLCHGRLHRAGAQTSTSTRRCRPPGGTGDRTSLTTVTTDVTLGDGPFGQ